MSTGDDQDHRARATFRWFLEHVLESPSSSTLISPDPMTCPNCGAAWTDKKSPYCSQACREESSFVRQLRRLLQTDQVFELEKQATQGQILWHLLGGGYPRRNAMVLPRAKEKLFAREEGRCQSCGAVAVTFDHIGSACNRPINLKVMCDDCAETKEFGDTRIVGKPEIQERLRHLADRIASPVAMRPSDDPESWDWRAFIKPRGLGLIEN